MVEIPTTVKNKELVERRRKQIVLAGIKLFSRNGFHKTTLKELAEEAGLSYGNIYDYVGSKEDIFFLIHDFLAGSAMEILNRSIEDIQDPPSSMQTAMLSRESLPEFRRTRMPLFVIIFAYRIVSLKQNRKLLKRS